MDAKALLIRETDTVQHLIERINRTEYGLAVAVDSKSRLKGVVTDFDLRLALATGRANPEDLAIQLGTKTGPAVVHSSEAAQAARRIREQRLPSVVEVRGGKVVAIRTRESLKITRPVVEAVVMAGGRGQRLRPLTDKVPKPLLKMGNMTIIERIISNLADAEVEKVWVAVNYKARSFEKTLGDGRQLGVPIDFLREETKLDTAGALSLLPKKPKGPVLVTNADILTRLNYRSLIDFHLRHGHAATIAAVHHGQQIPYGVIRSTQGVLDAIEEKPEIRVLCNAGIYVFEPKVLNLIKRNEPIAMPELLERITQKGWKIGVFPIVEKWFDIGSPEDFQRVLIEFATGEEQ